MSKIIFSILFGVLLSLCYVQAQPFGIRCGSPIINPPLSYADSIANVGVGDLRMFVDNYYNAYKVLRWGTKNQSRCTLGSVLVDDGSQTRFVWLDSLSTIGVDKVISIEMMADDVLTSALYGTVGAECGVMRLKIKRKED